MTNTLNEIRNLVEGMHLMVHGVPATAVAAVYDGLMHACACTYTLTKTDTQLCRVLKMEPEPQSIIL